jgi:hypothetical protein
MKQPSNVSAAVRQEAEAWGAPGPAELLVLTWVIDLNTIF